MNSISDIVYSNDLCSAFLTAIAKSFQERYPKGYLGRTAMQKLTYFSKVLGAPIPCSFGIYTYGPYSDTVTFSVESLLADEVLGDSSPSPKYSNYIPARNSAALLSSYKAQIEPFESTIHKVVDALGGFDPNDLELIATLHFIARRQVQRTGKLNRQAVVMEFKSIKKDKFDDVKINAWYDALERAKLIVETEQLGAQQTSIAGNS